MRQFYYCHCCHCCKSKLQQEISIIETSKLLLLCSIHKAEVYNEMRLNKNSSEGDSMCCKLKNSHDI